MQRLGMMQYVYFVCCLWGVVLGAPTTPPPVMEEVGKPDKRDQATGEDINKEVLSYVQVSEDAISI